MDIALIRYFYTERDSKIGIEARRRLRFESGEADAEAAQLE
jgi:hypothetical protein